MLVHSEIETVSVGKRKISKKVSPAKLREIATQGGDKVTAEGCSNLYKFISEGLESKAFTVDQVSYSDVCQALGIVDPFQQHNSVAKFMHESRGFNPVLAQEGFYFHESNPGLLTNSFQTVTQALLSSAVIEGYQRDYGYIGDQLVTTMRSTRQTEKIPGFTALDGPKEVSEGHPYPETGFEDKFVTTTAYKKGRIISVSTESLLFDQTGQINIRMRDIGEAVRQERERVIVRGVQDADSSTRPVFRPGGTAEALYSSSNLNLIGTSGVTGFTSANPLTDWTSVDTVLKMRATKIVDDRVDGTPLPIAGLNSNRCKILVPETLYSTGWYIANASGQVKNTASAVNETNFSNPVQGFIGGLLKSPFVDEVSTTTWYYGDFQRQFIWQEIMPLETFVQGADSEAGFERDTAMRIKVRYYGGIAARDSYLVTKVLGA